ncbi:alpha/beta fold hydrolase [Butyrivibrio sp. XPD2006]|uniref:alpha/beta fold hydrolase n=1 Tax=Butyrivibrio sp. XPD2006 TaxID=1280668 RepID=UPI0003B56088|nr:alpha/beta hydrolase [Butyrivibrio sp. XPD2006]
MAETGMVWTEDFEMGYCRFGFGNKTFVILPGLSVQSVIRAKEAVEASYAMMGGDFTTYLFDRKYEVSEGYTIYDMADDTAKAMKELGLKDVYLFGASQGGMIAMTIAIRYPELVKKLVLGNTSSHVKPEQRAVIDHWIELARDKAPRELYQDFGKEVYPAEVYEQYREYFDNVAETVKEKDLEKFVVLAETIKDFDVTNEIEKIKCPVLIIGAFDDAVLDSDATMEIAEKLDNRTDCALYMYNGYGHASFDTAPDYRKRVYDFLMKTDDKTV